MNADKLAADDARRIAQHETIKGKLQRDVQAQLAEKAAASTPATRAQFERLAADLKRQATDEVRETEADLARARHATRAEQVLDYVFFLVYSLIGLQIGLELLGARQSNPFKQALDFVTTPLLGPFRGLMPDPALGSLQLMLSYVVALIVYVLLHQALDRLLRVLAKRPAKA
jgi:uncharacterized protein YggT (Ycf19 family)